MGRHLRRTTAADRLIGLPTTHRRLILAGWLLAVAIAAVLAQGLPALLSGGGWSVAGSESARAAALSAQGFTGRGATSLTLVVRDEVNPPGSIDFDTKMADVIDEVSADPALAVESRFGWADLSAQSRGPFVSDDGQTVIEYLALSLDDGTARRELPSIQADLTERYAGQGVSVTLVGAPAFWGEITALSADGLVKAEMITLPLLLIILLLLYGGVVAAMVSMVVAGTSIVFTSALLTLIAQHVELSVFVENTATMLGLGIGVDYSLFVISRFKEELSTGRTVDEALSTTLRTSGHTVLASGLTVVIALATLFIIPLTVISSIALGGVLVVAFSVFVTIVLLPLLLKALGPRIAYGRLPFLPTPSGRPSSRWYSFALTIMRRPVLFLAISGTILLLCAAPALDLRTFTPDARIVPTESAVRTGYDQVSDGFGAGVTAPISVVIDADAPLDATTGTDLVRVRDALRELPGATAVLSALDVGDVIAPDDPGVVVDPTVRTTLPPDARTTLAHYLSADGYRAVLEVIGTDYSASPAAEDLLNRVRSAVAEVGGPWEVAVGGETAESIDSNDVISDHLPTVVAVMLIVVYLLLLATFRSVLLPLKAIVMNLLSLGATYGVLVLVFQYGFGAELLGVEQGPVQNFVPVLLLALLFSLSTDYEVFLLSRVREEYRATGDNDRSVADGLARTAPLISGAAVLMVAVFGAFAFTAILPIKQLGLGMAVAIAIDATLIRLVVVPASMRLLGPWNWWPGVPRARRETPSTTVLSTAVASTAVLSTAAASTALLSTAVGPPQPAASSVEGQSPALPPQNIATTDDADSAAPVGRHAKVTAGV